jgi:putative endonuclease
MPTTEQKQKAHRYGLLAERLAALYLTCKGYRIIAGRYRNVLGEIDLLALRGDTLAVVEVKARKTLAQCEETITPQKQQRLARAVQGILGNSKIAGLANGRERNIRFDVIWIAPWQWPRHIKDAWRM